MYNFQWNAVFISMLSINSINLKFQTNPLTKDYSCPAGYTQIKLNTGTTSTSRSEHRCHSYWIFWTKCHDDYYSSTATYDFYWCVNTGKIEQVAIYLVLKKIFDYRWLSRGMPSKPVTTWSRVHAESQTDSWLLHTTSQNMTFANPLLLYTFPNVYSTVCKINQS
jgi:hypothetical protein